MKTMPHRVVIYAKDLENLTGRKPRTCHTMMEKMRKFFRKSKDQFITVKECSEFLNIPEELIRDFLVS